MGENDIMAKYERKTAGLLLNREIVECIVTMPDEQRHELLDSVFMFYLDPVNVYSGKDPFIRTMFKLASRNITTNLEGYKERCERNRMNRQNHENQQNDMDSEHEEPH